MVEEKTKQNTPPVKKGSKWNILLLIFITGLVLYFSLKDNFTEVVKELFTLNPFWLLVAFLLILSFFFFKALRFKSFVRKYKKEYRFRDAYRMILNTHFFNGVTPFSSGGQPFQIYMLKKEGISIPEGTNIVVQDFIIYQIALVLLGSVAIIVNYFGNFLKESVVLKDLVTVGFIINFLVIVGLFTISFAEKLNKYIITHAINILARMKIIKEPEDKKQEWINYVKRFHKGAKLLFQDKVFFIKALLANLMSLICQYLVPLAIIYGMGDYTSINGLQTIMTSAYVMLVGSFVPIPGGTGGLEYAYIAFFGNFLNGTILQASMLMWRFVTYYFGIILGAISLNWKGVSRK